MGFAQGETFVSMTRRRYRLVSNPTFQLLHYTSIPSEAPKIPVQMNKIKVQPRDPLFFKKFEQSMGNVSNFTDSQNNMTSTAVPPMAPTPQYVPVASVSHAKKKAKVNFIRKKISFLYSLFLIDKDRDANQSG
jgi:hypothetical protein